MPLTMSILRKIPHFNIKRVQGLIDRGLVRPLQPDDDEEDVKSAVTSTAEPWDVHFEIGASRAGLH